MGTLHANSDTLAIAVVPKIPDLCVGQQRMRDRNFACVRETLRLCVCVCVSVCVKKRKDKTRGGERKRERESVCVCVREREKERERERETIFITVLRKAYETP